MPIAGTLLFHQFYDVITHLSILGLFFHLHYKCNIILSYISLYRGFYIYIYHPIEGRERTQAPNLFGNDFWSLTLQIHPVLKRKIELKIKTKSELVTESCWMGMYVGCMLDVYSPFSSREREDKSNTLRGRLGRSWEGFGKSSPTESICNHKKEGP